MAFPVLRFSRPAILTATICALYALLAPIVCAQAKAGSHAPPEIQAIDALTDKDIAACMNNDVDMLCSLWTDDAVLIMPATAPLVGRKAICSRLQEQKTKSLGSMPIAYNEDWQEVRLMGDYAWQWGNISQTDADQAGKQKTTEVNALRILHRERDGSWKVARAVVTPAGK